MTDSSPAPRRAPVLGVLSLVLAALPLVLTGLYWAIGPSALDVGGIGYRLALLAWSGIPLLWLPSLGIGIATVLRTRLGRWRIAGIPAIVLPLAELGVVVWFLVTVVGGV